MWGMQERWRELNSYAQDGWRVVSVVWNNGMSYYSAILEK